MRGVLIVLAGLSCLAGCPSRQALHRPRLVLEPVTGRPYYLFLPRACGRDGPAPVIVSCHGTDPFNTAALQASEWYPLAGDHGCILVCPFLESTDLGLVDAPSIQGLKRDEGAILKIIEALGRQHDIDRRNILMTGFSTGGHPAYFVGLRHPEVFSVVVARSCAFKREVLEGRYPPEAKAVPVLVYHNQRDPEVIRAASKNAVRCLRAAGFSVTRAVLPGPGHEMRAEVAMKFFLEHWRGTPPPFRPPPNSRISPRLTRRLTRR